MIPYYLNIKLSHDEFDYLCKSKFLSSYKINFLANNRIINNKVTLLFDKYMSEKFRDKLTEELARIGFGENYELNHEGKILEILIYRFFSY